MYQTKVDNGIIVEMLLDANGVVKYDYHIYNKKWCYDSRMEMIANQMNQEKVAKAIKKDKKIGRNSPCPCKSGKKYKKCCGRYGK